MDAAYLQKHVGTILAEALETLTIQYTRTHHQQKLHQQRNSISTPTKPIDPVSYLGNYLIHAHDSLQKEIMSRKERERVFALKKRFEEIVAEQRRCFGSVMRELVVRVNGKSGEKVEVEVKKEGQVELTLSSSSSSSSNEQQTQDLTEQEQDKEQKKDETQQDQSQELPKPEENNNAEQIQKNESQPSTGESKEEAPLPLDTIPTITEELVE